MNPSYEHQFAIIGKRLKFYREEAKLTTATAAQLAGVSYATLCNAENGKLNFRMLNFMKIADSLNIPPQVFFRSIHRDINYTRDSLETEIINALPDLSNLNLEMLNEMVKTLRKSHYNFNTIPTPAAKSK